MASRPWRVVLVKGSSLVLWNRYGSEAAADAVTARLNVRVEAAGWTASVRGPRGAVSNG